MPEQTTIPVRRSHLIYMTGALNVFNPSNCNRRWFVIKVGKRKLIEQHKSASLAIVAAQLRLGVHGASAWRLS